jgi:hypothetical protein
MNSSLSLVVQTFLSNCPPVSPLPRCPLIANSLPSELILSHMATPLICQTDAPTRSHTQALQSHVRFGVSRPHLLCPSSGQNPSTTSKQKEEEGARQIRCVVCLCLKFCLCRRLRPPDCVGLSGFATSYCATLQLPPYFSPCYDSLRSNCFVSQALALFSPPLKSSCFF